MSAFVVKITLTGKSFAHFCLFLWTFLWFTTWNERTCLQVVLKNVKNILLVFGVYFSNFLFRSHRIVYNKWPQQTDWEDGIASLLVFGNVLFFMTLRTRLTLFENEMMARVSMEFLKTCWSCLRFLEKLVLFFFSFQSWLPPNVYSLLNKYSCLTLLYWSPSLTSFSWKDVS